MTEAADKDLSREWTVADRYAALLPEIEAALRSQSGVVVKESAARIVFRLIVNGETFYAKQYRTPTLTDKTRFAFAQSKGRKEWDLLNAAHTAGAAVPAPVAYFERRQGALLGENWLVTAGILDAQPWKDWLESRYDCFAGCGDLARKRTVIEALAECLCGFYRTGLAHNDLHPGNLLFHEQSGRFILLDIAGALKATPSPTHVLKSLAQFAAYFQLYGSRLDRARFWRAFVEAMKWPASKRKDLARKLERQAEAWNHSFWEQRRKRVFENNKDYQTLPGDGVRGSHKRSANLPVDGIHDRLQFLLAGGAVLKDGRATRVVKGELKCADGSTLPVVLKAFKVKKTGQAIKDLFRGSRGARCWQSSLDFELRRIASPAAYLYADRTMSGGLISSLFLTADVGPLPKIYQYFPSLLETRDRRQIRGFIHAFAHEMARMHRRCLYHGDLKGDNVFVVTEPRLQFLFIDIDQSTTRKAFSEMLAVRDLSQILKEFRKWATPRQHLRFLRAYLQGLGKPEKALRAWAAKITAKAPAV